MEAQFQICSFNVKKNADGTLHTILCKWKFADWTVIVGAGVNLRLLAIVGHEIIREVILDNTVYQAACLLKKATVAPIHCASNTTYAPLKKNQGGPGSIIIMRGLVHFAIMWGLRARSLCIF